MIIGDNMSNIIDMCTVDFLNKILRDSNFLNGMYINSLQMKDGITKFETNQGISRMVARAVELYMKNLVMSSNMVGDERLTNYRNALQAAINQDPTYIFESEILKLPKDKLLGIMSEEMYDKFSQYKGTLDKYCSAIYDKLINGEEVPTKERHTLMNFLYSNVGTSDKRIHDMQENIVKRIINGGGKYDYQDADFFVAYIANEEAKNYGYDSVCCLSDLRSMGSGGTRGVATAYRIDIDANYALNSMNSANREDIATLIHTVCHEAAHVKQTLDVSKNICNKDTLDIIFDRIFRQELTKENFEFYRTNYYFDSGEKDAEKKGYLRADTYIYEYMEDEREKQRVSYYLHDKKDHEIYADMISMRKDESLKKFDADKFRIEKMSEILKKNGHYFSKCPQLKYLYNINGDLRSFSSRLIAYTNFQKKEAEDDADMFLSSFNYSVDNGDISTIDFSKMSKDDFFKTMHALSDLYNVYSKMSHNVLESVRLGNDFLNDNRISNPVDYRDRKVSVMASRYKKLECILDAFYEKYGNVYGSVDEYRHDQEIYKRDKEYTRLQFGKIKKKLNNQKEIGTMLTENKPQEVQDENINSK